jgi:beta-glucanase (GH16 family)
VKESPVEASMTEWHTYAIEWGVERATFSVDGETVLDGAPSPRGPLGFVMWLDNQYMVVKPWGRFGWGLLEEPARQWLEVDWLSIED